ncbi:MAG: DUF3104 domain-containing protein [Synechococcus sp.]
MSFVLPLSIQIGDLVVVGDPEELNNNPASTNWFLGEVINTTSARRVGSSRAVQIWNVDTGVVSWERASRVTRALARRQASAPISLNTDCVDFTGAQHWRSPNGGIDGGNHSTPVMENCNSGVIA